MQWSKYKISVSLQLPVCTVFSLIKLSLFESSRIFLLLECEKSAGRSVFQSHSLY
ncbi:hypothetical protein RHMOL_Rhmol05G0206500 [Rhododendron molle]|uniref:Uncharacterized protein n=1 Tax=Rhododendron molle TaxID=49168 RepID=A0ACC0NSC2_RHOML|nr:hypothetical protein RHMOL_Rhmol05G0206500 [Rhododendron molle]